MTIDMHSTAPRRSARRVARGSAVVLGLVLGSLALPAAAAPPDSWEDPDNGSMLELLLILGGIPLAVILVLMLLVYLPSMMRKSSSEPALAFQERSEWFGGPRKGVDAAPQQVSDAETVDKGGASARW